MFEIRTALNVLKNNWWGLIIAYLICVIISYLAIWAIIEPLCIPENLRELQSVPTFIIQRWFVHLIGAIVLGAFLALVLDMIFRVHLTKLYRQLAREKQGPVSTQTLEEYEKAFNGFCQQLSYAIGRFREHQQSPDKADVNYVMKRVNEVRQTRMRLLKVCGQPLRSLLIEAGTEWLNDMDSFMQTAFTIETKLSELALQDRRSIQQTMIEEK
ncbi:MAG: hypothetical protein MUO43_17110 [Desulfobacterales bacterium]|nr:hypothetical protein [Desulfobacterales bacterium]